MHFSAVTFNKSMRQGSRGKARKQIYIKPKECHHLYKKVKLWEGDIKAVHNLVCCCTDLISTRLHLWKELQKIRAVWWLRTTLGTCSWHRAQGLRWLWGQNKPARLSREQMYQVPSLLLSVCGAVSPTASSIIPWPNAPKYLTARVTIDVATGKSPSGTPSSQCSPQGLGTPFRRTAKTASSAGRWHRMRRHSIQWVANQVFYTVFALHSDAKCLKNSGSQEIRKKFQTALTILKERFLAPHLDLFPAYPRSSAKPY